MVSVRVGMRRRRFFECSAVCCAIVVCCRNNFCAVPPFRRVLIVGATHGNEFTGPWCIRRIEQDPQLVARPSLEAVKTLIGNPQAYKDSRRFVDEDLNRQFRPADLEGANRVSYEQQRAKVLTAYGAGMDFVVDLHTTTTSMGITYIVEGWSDVGLAAAVWCQQFLQPRVASGELPPVYIIRESIKRDDCPHLIAMGREGIMIEVGPIPQGILRHDVCAWMEAAITAVMDFLEALNTGALDLPHRATVFRDIAVKIPVPLGDDGKPTALFHSSFQGRDFMPLCKGDPMFVRLDGEVIAYNGSHGDKVWPTFVNEGAYYLPESGLGFCVTVQEDIEVPAPPVVAWLG